MILNINGHLHIYRTSLVFFSYLSSILIAFLYTSVLPYDSDII